MSKHGQLALGYGMTARRYRRIYGVFPEGIGAYPEIDLSPGAVNHMDRFSLWVFSFLDLPIGGLVMTLRAVLPIRGCGNDV